eukprot:2832382-Pleurochrysis_carterae.AAC.1
MVPFRHLSSGITNKAALKARHVEKPDHFKPAARLVCTFTLPTRGARVEEGGVGRCYGGLTPPQ